MSFLTSISGILVPRTEVRLLRGHFIVACTTTAGEIRRLAALLAFRSRSFLVLLQFSSFTLCLFTSLALFSQLALVLSRTAPAAAAPGPAMVAYRNALRDKGWQVTTIVTSEGGTGGGATYTGTNGDAYTVVDGGGFEQQTFIDICLWPKRPEEPNCTRAKR